jgi:hypothetical protein
MVTKWRTHSVVPPTKIDEPTGGAQGEIHLRRASAKSEWEIAATLFPEAELLVDLLHFRMARNQENRTRLLILAAHLENAQQYTVSKSGSVLAIALGDDNLFWRITEDDIADRRAAGDDAKQPVADKGKREVVAPAQIFGGRRESEQEGETGKGASPVHRNLPHER